MPTADLFAPADLYYSRHRSLVPPTHQPPLSLPPILSPAASLLETAKANASACAKKDEERRMDDEEGGGKREREREAASLLFLPRS
jgi:hypothetical protein